MLEPIRWRSGRQHPKPPPPAPHRFDTTKIPERVTMRPKRALKSIRRSEIDLRGFRWSLLARRSKSRRHQPSRTRKGLSAFDCERDAVFMRGARLEVTIYGRSEQHRYAPYRESPDIPIAHVDMRHENMGMTKSLVRASDLLYLRQHRQLASVSSDRVRDGQVVLERVCRLP